MRWGGRAFCDGPAQRAPQRTHEHVRGLSHKACAATNLHDEPVELEINMRALHAPGPGVLHDLRVVAGVDHDPDHKRRVAQCAADVLVVERDVLLLSLVLHRPTEALEIGVREFKGDVALEVLDGFTPRPPTRPPFRVGSVFSLSLRSITCRL